ncbi:D-alanyl-D-alanine carboxypeptidase/D-alanyl-D-alanine-endopeptidase [Kutzneria buriramensis]|nr:D-alanyl-D-alanine carboxypeptidase/D-alanyl-D-alanine-endopeptidase [Kutzneria buriramensis]
MRLADISSLEDTVTSLESTITMPVDNDRARLDPPTVQMSAPVDTRRGDDSPTVRVQLPRPPAAGRPELGDDVPQPAPQLPPPPRDHDDDALEVPAPRRSRRPALVGLAIVVVLAVGCGVWFGAPSVVQALGFGGTTAIPTAPPPSPAAPEELLKPVTNAPTPSAEGIAAALAGPAGSPALGTLTGTVIDPATGTTLWDHNSTTPLTPASSGKLLATTAALLSLDPQFRFTTTVVAGPDPDTVIIVGGGDPSLSSLPDGKESVYPGAAHLDDLVAQVKQATGGAVHKVLFDTSRYSGDAMAPGWEASDIAGGSVAPITPLMLDGGRSRPTVSEPPRTATPDVDAAKEFARRLGADPNSVAKTTAPAGAKVLGSVQSPPLTDMISNLLQISDNVMAEAVGREVAKQAGAPTTFAGGASSVLNILRSNNFDLSGVTMMDGSGLSTQDRVPAKLFGSIMSVAAGPAGGNDARVAKLRPLLIGLPVAGGSGTLSDRYNDATSAPGKGWVRAKTGTLDGVNTLAGIVQDTDGKVLAFALMSNGSQIDQGRAALDDVAAALRGCGCR